MNKQIVINRNSSETRIALLENDRVAEIQIERHQHRGIVGNIYAGTVSRVLPGMQAAFVNIGTNRMAFLYGGDVYDPQAQPLVEEGEDPSELTPEELRERQKQRRRPIEKLLREGQRVLVQVAKEPLGSKGARVTTYLSVPGRCLVLMPNFSHTGISRRISCEDERTRLTTTVDAMKPEGFGVIVRTAAEGSHENSLRKDLEYLQNAWQTIETRRESANPPELLYRDLDIVQKTVRDTYSEEVDKIIVDDEECHGELKEFLKSTIPEAVKSLEFYEPIKDKTPLFDVYGIEVDIGRALGARIDLPSGGYLIIDQTEALTSFDVNTGKFVGQLSARETILKTNLESVNQIVAQLRVRNIGGIIVIDFIDMENLDDRDLVYEKLQEELLKDKARTNVLRISELGLVQMTRKRTSESLERQLMEPCPFCDGRGRVRSTVTETFDLLREIQRHAQQTGTRRMTIRIRNDVRARLENEEKALFETIKESFRLRVTFQSTDLTTSNLNDPPFEVVSQ